MRQPIKCCRECQTRYVGCHAECKKYLEEREVFEAEKDAIYKDRAKRRLYDDYISKQNQKRKKRHGR